MIASNRCSLFRVDGLFTHHHPSFRGAPVCVSRQPNRVAGSVDPGLERQRAQTLGQVLVSHGNQHYGFIQLLRQLIGKDEPGT